MKIVVVDGYTLNPGDNPWDPVRQYGETVIFDRSTGDQVVERANGADIILANKTQITAQAMAQLPNLKFISVLATGYNNIDTKAAAARKIPVSNVPIYGTDSVAQYAFALLLEMCHHISLHDEAVKAGEWTSQPDFCFWKKPQIELAGLTMGIVGLGRIGQRVGELAHAFGMNVIASAEPPRFTPSYKPFEWAENEEIFERADVVSLHCPLTATNERMVNKQLLARAKPSMLLINTSRGPLINEPDLALALREGKIAGAALDVVSVEPIKPDNPLLSAPNCINTPHIAWATLSARRRLMHTTADNVKAFIDGKPINVVNF